MGKRRRANNRVTRGADDEQRQFIYRAAPADSGTPRHSFASLNYCNKSLTSRAFWARIIVSRSPRHSQPLKRASFEAVEVRDITEAPIPTPFYSACLRGNARMNRLWSSEREQKYLWRMREGQPAEKNVRIYHLTGMLCYHTMKAFRSSSCLLRVNQRQPVN